MPVLDPQAAGARLRRRLRICPRGRIEGCARCSGRRRRNSSWPNIISTARLPGRRAATWPRPRSGPGIWKRWRLITSSSRSGRRTAPQLSQTARRWSAPRLRAWKAGSWTPMRLYEEAIRLAREHGFVQNEGLANELAARFYAARGFETIADAYLRNARSCYLRWGADGKVRQLEQLHPQLRQEPAVAAVPTAPSGRRSSSWISRRWSRSHRRSPARSTSRKLIDTLMVIALEHAGAERGLLILLARRRAADRGGGHDRPRHGRGHGFDRAHVTPVGASRIGSSLCHPDAGQRAAG